MKTQEIVIKELIESDEEFVHIWYEADQPLRIWISDEEQNS